MERHFTQWSKVNLTILGKIQIYKTFGLSQFLYHLSVIKPEPAGWNLIIDQISKFPWNKGYSGTKAPSRIKAATMLCSVDKGCYAMIRAYVALGKSAYYDRKEGCKLKHTFKS